MLFVIQMLIHGLVVYREAKYRCGWNVNGSWLCNSIWDFQFASMQTLFIGPCFWHGLGWICVTFHVKEEKLLETYHSNFSDPNTTIRTQIACHLTHATKTKYTKWSPAFLAVILMTSGILIFITKHRTTYKSGTIRVYTHTTHISNSTSPNLCVIYWVL